MTTTRSRGPGIAPSTLCEKLKPLKKTWSCTSRVHTDYETLKAMKEAGCRLLIVGFESGDDQILKNIKKGATVEQGARVHEELQKARHSGSRRFHHRAARRNAGNNQDARSSMPKRWIAKRFRFRSRIRIPAQSSMIIVKKNNYLLNEEMTDEMGHQLPVIQYPGSHPRRDSSGGRAFL